MRTIEELLAKLTELQEKQAKGEDVTAELKQVRDELEARKAADAAAANGGGDNPPDNPDPVAQLRAELDAYKAADQERQEREQATAIAQQVVKEVNQRHADQQERIKSYALDAVKQVLGGEAVDSVALEIAKSARGGSRFAGPGSDLDVVKHLAAGGSIGGEGSPFQLAQGGPAGQIRVGEHRGVKEIMDSKSIGRFMAILAKAKAEPFTLQEHEALFLRQQSEKAMSQGTATAGGYLVPEEWMPDILGVLRAQAVVRRANPRVVPFNKQMNQISISSGSTAYYVAENARITPSELTLAQAAVLTPKFLTALVPVSNVLLRNAPGVDTTIRDDMVEAITTREDLAFIMGLGTGGEPRGFRNMTGALVNPLVPGANGFVPTLAQFRQIRGATRIAGVQNPRWTWFFHPALLTYLETLTDTTGRFLVDSGLLSINADGISGTFDGLPFYASYQIPINLTLGTSTNVSFVLLVNMANAIVGEDQALEFAVSDQATYSPDGGTTHLSAFQQNQTVFRAIISHDIAHRRPTQGVIVQEGVRV